VATIIFDFGFNQSIAIQNINYWIYIVVIIIGTFSLTVRYFSSRDRPLIKVWAIDILLFLFLSTLIFNYFEWFHFPLLDNRRWLYGAICFLFIREFSALNIDYKKRFFNPAQLFIFSFLVIILLGTILLILPNATHTGISLIDALFTSTSAVCVTGLVVVDTGNHFTQFGQIIVVILIQLGGLGIMTFASYFSYFFRGGSTYYNQLILKNMTNAEKIADAFSTLKKIILFTFSIEAVGALLIYTSLDKALIPSTADRTFFSIFHSVSGFCNAGFSTLSNSLYDIGFRFNYSLHLIIAFLFIIGGIGFPILFNFYKALKHLVMNRLFTHSQKKQTVHVPWILNINTRIVLITTFILILFGTFFFFLFEYNNTLTEHNGIGKIITAFFSAVTPRTAGFNTVDYSALNVSTIMFMFLLMWVGASPASTGGGIKTSTFAIGILNFINLARGKDRIELFHREVADISVKRSFAIISLSLIVIGTAVFSIALLDSDKDLLPIVFECISAYSTVGLSLGITDDLSNASKMVIIITMFIGRVSMLTILIAVFHKVKHLKYRFPTEEILIN
jgi:potassium uptake TrkH family protein